MSKSQATDIVPLLQPHRGAVTVLRRAIDAMASPAGDGRKGVVPFGVADLDHALDGGLALGALHEIAAARESEIAAASGLALALAARQKRPVLWIAEDMALVESGMPYGPGLDDLGLAPERLVAVTAAKTRDVLWAMEEALTCRGVGAVIGEIRSPCLDLIATRRLSLAAGRRDQLALLMRTQPGTDASTAATRAIVGAEPSAPHVHGPSRLAFTLTRNRRGPLGSWNLEWNRVERRFDLAPAHREPVAQAAFHRSHRAAGAAYLSPLAGRGRPPKAVG
jgi:protein ImuA